MRAGTIGVRVALAAALALSSLAATSRTPRDYTDPESAIRFAFSPSDLAAARAGDPPTYAALHDYLEGVLARIETSPSWRDRQKPHVEISAGSDYQVMAWLQKGEVDAAVVTPFMARLLLTQDAAIPIVELVRPEGPGGLGDARGHWPVAWSPTIPPPTPPKTDDEGQRETRRHGALFQLGGFLQEAEQDAAARADGFAAMPATSYDARFVSHLSTDGFAAPIACAARWIQARKTEHTWSRSRQERVETRFWTSLLERSSFTFDAAETVRFAAPPERIPMRFASIEPPPAPEQEPWELRRYAPSSSCGGRSRIGLLPDDLGDATPPIPNDVVVITPHLARELGFETQPVALPEYDPETGERKPKPAKPAEPASEDDGLPRPPPCVSPATGEAPWLPGWSPEVCDLWLPPEGARALGGGSAERTGYAAVQPLQAATWDAFEREIYAPFEAHPVLKGWLTTFYREGGYPFGLGDLARLLRHDQAGEREPGAALVLPGGGVKSAYQARILDILYQTYMTNAGDRTTARGGDDRLRVRHVVGTSGGAIVGLLAAQTPPYGCSELTSLWTQVRSSRDVFPFLNLLRALSVLVLVALLSAVLSLVVWRDRDVGPPVAPGDVSVPLVAFLLLIVVLAPLVVASVIEREDLGSLTLAGVLYVAIVAAAHFALHAVVRKPEQGEASVKTRAAQAVAFTVVSILAIGLSVHLASGGDGLPLPSGHWRAPAVAAALLALQLGILWVSVGRRKSLVVPKERARLYLQAMVLVGAYVAVAYGLVSLLAGAGFTPLFEITGRFWAFLLLCGLVVAGAIVAWSGPAKDEKLWFGTGWRAFRQWMKSSVSYLGQGDPTRRVPPPRTSLVALFAAALAWWTVCLGHSLYASEVSFRFIDRVARARAAHAVPGSPPLHANLVVTGSALERSCADTGTPRPAGDFYFCFSAPGGCPPVRNPRWHDGRADDLSQVVDAVVASGSPVPVLPERVVTLPDGCRVPLVDGGFAHNEPIEAARHLGARQVLLVRSQPDPEALRKERTASGGGLPFPSRLVSNLGGILPFLFERSQQVDRSVARSLLVAYVAPDPSHGAFPLLTDFRRPVIERMIQAADEDALGLVGRVESWGVPRPLVSIAPGTPKAPRNGAS